MANVTNTVAASGATETLDASASPDDVTHDVTLTANCTLTLTAPDSARPYNMTIILRQDATGARTVTWPSSVKWGSDIAPVLTTTPSAVDVVTLFTINGGTSWLGFAAGFDMR